MFNLVIVNINKAYCVADGDFITLQMEHNVRAGSSTAFEIDNYSNSFYFFFF